MAKTVIIGAGPAGLTAALEAAKLGREVEVFEKDELVGGISRTVSFEGYRFDIGGHRFFTKSPLIQEIWQDLLGDELISRDRLSRIHYRGKFFAYPLRPLEALRGLGLVESLRIGLSYLAVTIWPNPIEKNFEQWVSNRFGRRLYQIFFETYTEKVWGMPCSEISSDWASQRIKNLDFLTAARAAILGRPAGGEVVTTLIDRFLYPRLGPGMMWETCRDRIEAMGAEVQMKTPVHRLCHENGSVSRITATTEQGDRVEVETDQVISSMPLGELIRRLDPPAPREILEAADSLRYRDFLTVVLIVRRSEVFPDNWIYVHSPEVRVGRIQNFKNWSDEMVPDPAMTSLGLEYFVNEGDDLWTRSDEELKELGAREVASLGLITADEVVDGVVLRMPKAYPVYDRSYRETVATIRGYLSGFRNLQTVGRNGQHRYNNQDHSMLTGVLAARNLEGRLHDVWKVNLDRSYLEEEPMGKESDDRLTPTGTRRSEAEEMLVAIFERHDPISLGISFAIVAGVVIFLATAALLLQEPVPAQPMLSLLGNYFLGFEVSWPGAFLGMVEAAIGGFMLGAVMATLVNALTRAYARSLRHELEMAKVFDPLVR